MKFLLLTNVWRAVLGLAAAALFQMLCAGLGGGAQAQVQQIANPAKTISPVTTGSLGFTRGSVVVAPVPFQSPSLDTGLALGGAYLFKADEQSDSSSIGGGAFKTSNGSEGFGVGWNLSFAQGCLVDQSALCRG